MSKATPTAATRPLGNMPRGSNKRPPKEQRDQDRIDRLTEAAFDLFSDRGYHNTPIELLCSTANVSTRDFYKLGKTREALMTRVYQHVALYVETCVLQALANAPMDDWQQRMDAAIDAWVDAYTSDTRYARLSYLESVGISDELEQVRTVAHERFAALIRNEFRHRFPDDKNILEGKLPVAIVGACNELAREWLGTSPRPPAEQLQQQIKQLYTIIIRGLDAG